MTYAQATHRSRDSGIPGYSSAADWAGIDRLKKPEIVRSCIEWAERFLPGVWADRVSRWCLLAAVAFFWLAVTLTAPVLVIPLGATVAGLWLRGDQRAKALAELTELSDPDFF